MGGAALLTCQTAFADGLVLSSSSDDFARGDVIKENDMILLAPGEMLEVLDQTGMRFEISTSMTYSAAANQAGAARITEVSKPSLMDAAFDSGKHAEIGGVRSEDLETCLTNAKTDQTLSEEMCNRARPDTSSAPELQLELMGEQETLTGAPLRLRIKSNIDAALLCPDLQVSNSSFDATWIRLQKNVTVMAPSRATRSFAAPTQSGEHEVSCLAIDLDSWVTLCRATNGQDTCTLAEAGFAKTYAEMRNAPIATTQFLVTVSP